MELRATGWQSRNSPGMRAGRRNEALLCTEDDQRIMRPGLDASAEKVADLICKRVAQSSWRCRRGAETRVNGPPYLH